MKTKFTNVPLNRDAFSSAIRKGQGRALMHVLEHGIDGVDDLILDACLHNYCYDTQIDSDRASWLFRMFDNPEYYSRFADEILAYLPNATNLDDQRQMSGLAREMAVNGNDVAKKVLREFVMGKASVPFSDDWMGRYDWIDLDGLQGFLDLAKIYGQRLLTSPDDFVPDDLFPFDKAIASLGDILDQAGRFPELIAYKSYLVTRQEQLSSTKSASNRKSRKQIREQAREEFRQEFPLDLILECAKNKEGHLPTRYMNFGKYATAAELDAIYNQLFIDADNDVVVRFLWVFRRTPLPKLDDLLFMWASEGEGQLRSAAITALAQVSNPRIHELAQTKVVNGNLLGDDNDSLDLFLHNYESDDIHKIIRAVNELPVIYRHDAHGLGTSILALYDKHENADFEDALKWVYENTPCAHCRYNSIKKLKELDKLSPRMLYECKFDGEANIRDFVENLM